MSKFDNVFNKIESNKNTNTNTNNGSVFKTNIFLSKNKSNTKEYAYKDNEFPDLVVSNKQPSAVVQINDDKKYANITSITTTNEVKIPKENTVPPGWVQYSKPKGSNKSLFIVTHGDKTKQQLQQEAELNMLNNPLYIHDLMISTLESNWNRYKLQYDAIHGEGAYDLVYYMEPRYEEDDNLSENASDVDNDNDYSYSSEEDYNFNNRKNF
jgi:hypothetical protein